MALKPCRECKKKVSTEAVTCPSCGVPNPTKPWKADAEYRKSLTSSSSKSKQKKSNLVKILATIGLVMAILLTIKGVIDVGKVGVNKISKNTIDKSTGSTNKNIIKFDKCWGKDESSNYEDYFRTNDFEEMFFEINLAAKKVTRNIVFKDAYIKKFKDWDGTVIPKVSLDNLYIKSFTDNYVETKNFNKNGLVYYYVFNLKNGQLTVNHLKPFSDTTNWQCNKFK